MLTEGTSSSTPNPCTYCQTQTYGMNSKNWKVKCFFVLSTSMDKWHTKNSSRQACICLNACQNETVELDTATALP